MPPVLQTQLVTRKKPASIEAAQNQVLGEKASMPCMYVMQAVSVQQSEDLAMSDANGAAMADLLSALDSALLNGEPGAHHPL